MDQEDILDTSQLSFDGDFDDQVQEILQFVRLTADRVEELQLIFNNLEDALQQLAPGCQVIPFGSIVTGLGIKTSDVDCHIVLPPNIAPTIRHVTGARNILKRYYRTFAQNVISPYLGRVITKKALEDLSTLPEELSLYKDHVLSGICVKIRMESRICLQDPFQHSKNCTVAIYERLAHKIISLFKFASKKYEEESPSSFLKSIFTEDPCIEQLPSPPPKHQRPGNTGQKVEKVPVIQNRIHKNNPKKAKRNLQNSFNNWFAQNNKNLRGNIKST
ncbi:uncharacterized protein LOC113495983 isoform X2 [Trichoplusia ni]|uniref:Uncharacterized protein LOC113495983 isoform X2 n=1 Tax=Trichoplusia ni TaxID=7111 RepID=A0A7E5VRA4_TRINI|nr:uncharacterized protein LOC113495983 isoform X2 [Trichoplusia ni]